MSEKISDQLFDTKEMPEYELEEKIKLKELNRISQFRRMQEMLPKDFKSILDKRIVGQEDAKKALSIALYKHCQNFFVDKVPKSNVLIFGPSGSGKTDMARCLAEELRLPFVLYDATKLTEAGYAGDDVSDMIKQLYYASGNDVELTEHGIVYIDEIDKLAGCGGDNNHFHGDIGKTGAQQSMLRLLEDDDVVIPINKGKFWGEERTEVTISTKNILFIGAGAFVKEAFRKEECLGFLRAEKAVEKEKCSGITAKDCVDFGFLPEFVRRFSKITQTQSLTEDELIAVLSKKDGNLLAQYKQLFYENGIRLSWTDDFLVGVAKKAMNEPTGVSALKYILDGIADNLLFTYLENGETSYNSVANIKLTQKDLKF